MTFQCPCLASRRLHRLLLEVDWHDRYPKPDLDGGYLGDGYPLCSDLAPRSFLSKGARYNFVGKDVNGYLEGEGALNLSLAGLALVQASLGGGIS